MASDHSGGDALGAVEAHTRAEGRMSAEAREELRQRMRLRLSATNAGQADGIATDPTGASSSISAGSPAAVNHMVWNSVIESLSTTMTSIASAMPQAPTTVPAQSAASPAAVAPSVNPPPPPIGPSTAENPAIASLFVPTPPIEFSALPVANPQGGSVDRTAIVAPPQPAVIPPVVPVQYAAPHQPSALPSPQSLVPLSPAFAPAPVSALAVVAAPAVLQAPTAPPAPVAVATNAPIAGSEVIVPAMPTLSQPSRAATVPKPVARVGLLDDQPAALAVAKKKKKRPFRTLMSFVIVLALIGGAAYFGYYNYLLKKDDWPADVQPLVDFVEQDTGKSFTGKIPVHTLDEADYEARLGDHLLSSSYQDPDGSFDTLRAVGLASQAPDATSAGHLGAALVTSFYDPADQTIYALEGSTAAFEVSMLRALTAALADQEVRWSEQTATLTDSQRVGYRALIDGLAAQVVAAKFAEDASLQSASADEFTSRRAAAGITDEGVPFSISGVLDSIENGAVLSPSASAGDALAALAAPASDAAVFDPARSDAVPSSPSAEPAPTSGTRTLGLQFWYEMLIPTLGIDGARSAALLWVSDDTVVKPANHPCVQSLISTASEQDQAALAAVLTQWAASRPASSEVTVSGEPANHVMLSACEPAEATSPPLSPPGAATLYTKAQVERDFVGEMSAAGLPDTPTSRNCSIVAFRGGSVPNYTVGSADVTIQQAMANLVSFCKGT